MSIISSFLIAAIVNNYVLANGFGFASSLTVSRNKDVKKFFLIVLVNIVVAGLACYAVDKYLLAELPFLTYLVNAVIIALVAYLLDKFLNNTDYNLFLFLALNTCIFALTMNITSLEIGDAIVQILACAFGYVLATLLLAGVRSKIQYKYVPSAFKGIPIELVAASIIAIALYAFK